MCPRKLTSALPKQHLFVKAPKYLFQVLYVLFFSLASDEDEVDTAEVETTQSTIDEAQEGFWGMAFR